MRERRTGLFGPALAALVLVAAACTNDGPDVPGPASSAPKALVKVAFLEDLSVEGSLARVIPAFQGARLAFNEATAAGDFPVQVVIVGEDTGGDAAAAASLARQTAADPEFAGVIGAPFLAEPVSAAAILDRARIFTLALSSLVPGLSSAGSTTWRRVVANEAEQGRALARLIGRMRAARTGVCVAGDGSVSSDELVGTVFGALRRRVVLLATLSPGGPSAGPSSLAAKVKAAGCGVLFWGGFSPEAAAIRLGLAAGRRKVALVGADGAKDDEYLATTGPAGEGTVVSCPCVDLSTSTELSAQRFIQDYQVEYGTPPGVYAAEGWDAARMFIAAFRSGATTARATADFLGGLGTFRGLANTYAFGPSGELARGSATVHFYRDEGGRWLPLERGGSSSGKA